MVKAMAGTQQNKCSVCCQKIQNGIFGNLERFFKWFGEIVARYPLLVIPGSLTFMALCCIGILNLYEETEQLELWVPTDSEFYHNAKWLEEAFPSNVRPQSFMLLTNDGSNILTKKNMQFLAKVNKDIANLQAVVTNKTSGSKVTVKQSDLCQEITCEDGKKQCLEISILGYFVTDDDACNNEATEAKINGTEEDKIIFEINNKTIPQLDIDTLVGGKVMENGKIVSGTALKVTLLNDYVEPFSEEYYHNEWELRYLWYINNITLPDGMEILPFAARSFGDEIGATIGGDANLLSMGFLVVFVYIVIMLGKFNLVEQRAYLALIGVAAIGMGIGTSIGISSLFGLEYTSMNTILPFLLLGIGIDDMFVIVQSFANIRNPEDLSKPLVQRFGLTLKHSGVAITITSFTDLMAFGIGATSVLPALRSFCIYTAIGIFSVFIYMVTFFLACFVLDQKRIETDRDGCCCCIKYQEYTPNACSQKSLLEKAFEKYAIVLVTIPFKVVVIVLTALFLALGCYGVALLKADFKFTSFLNEGTYLRKYFDTSSERYPDGGITGWVYVAENPEVYKYIKEINEMIKDVHNLNDSSITGSGVASFLPEFIAFVRADQGDQTYPKASDQNAMTNDTFNDLLKKFLCKERNKAKWGDSIKLYESDVTSLKCSDASSKISRIKAFTFMYTHRNYESSVGLIKGMNAVKEKIAPHKEKIKGGRVFAHSDSYNDAVTIEIITEELFRNIILATVCIFIVTLLLLTDILGSLMVLFCVIFTIVDVAGFMHFWGLTIDTVSALLLTVAMGLAVDYAAHIAHYFMTAEEGDRNERVRKTLINIGPAVVNGGFSTFLAFILLMTSKSYVFKTFFKIFFLVVTFGVYHGLVFLPVTLSLIGPKPHVQPAETKVEPMSAKKSAAWTTNASAKIHEK